MRVLFLSLISMVISFAALAASSSISVHQIKTIDTGNTAWLLISSALVMIMTPGLAFFYAGMVSRKNIVSTLLQNYVSLAVIGLLWVIIGYSLAFSSGNGFIGDTTFFMLKGLTNKMLPNNDANVPHYAFIIFQMMFAVIAPALITGSLAERVSFKGWLFVLMLWSLFVYCPVAHWVWAPDGWLAKDGGLDFAGGIVVHITAGVASLVAAILYGKREKTHSAPSDIPMIMLGATLLWFGWFGFNAGSSIVSGYLASHAFVNTYLGASAALICWMVLDWFKKGKPKAVGSAIGLVVGLVATTPAAGYVSIQSAIIMGGLAGIVCNLASDFMKKFKRTDDALDVFACHGVGGIIGALMTGMLASKEVNPTIKIEGILISGETGLFFANIFGVIVVAIFTAVMTYAIIKFVNLFVPVRVRAEAESIGLDLAEHGEKSQN